jgi:hypothetical protein
MRGAAQRIKKRAKVAALDAESKSDAIADQRLDRDMDDLTPGASCMYDVWCS